MDIAVNRTLKSIVTRQVCDVVAKEVAAAIREGQIPSIDVTLVALKSTLVESHIKGIK